MHKLLFLVTILLLLTFPQSFFLFIKKMLIQTHIARFRLHFLRKLRSWLLRKAQQKQKISIMVCCGHTLFECLIAFHVDIRRSIWQSLSIAFVHNLYLVDLLLYTERVFENLQWVKKNLLYPCFRFLGIWKIDAIFIFEHVISLTQPNGDHKLVTPYPRPCRLYMIFWPWNISWDV